MKTRILRSCCGGLIVLALMASFGCQSQITGKDVRSNISPELETLALTHEQHKNRTTRTVDTNLRGFWDDLDRFLLLDRPTRMSRLPVP